MVKPPPFEDFRVRPCEPSVGSQAVVYVRGDTVLNLTHAEGEHDVTDPANDCESRNPGDHPDGMTRCESGESALISSAARQAAASRTWRRHAGFEEILEMALGQPAAAPHLDMTNAQGLVSTSHYRRC
jgi:hypothetical protein